MAFKFSVLEDFDNFITSKAKEVVISGQKEVQNFFKPTEQVRIRDVIREAGKSFIPQTAKEAEEMGFFPIKYKDETGQEKFIAVDPFFSGGLKTITTPIKRGAVRAAKDFLKPVETRIKREGEAGKQLVKLITESADRGEIEAGKRIESFISTGLKKFDKVKRFNLLDVFEGNAKPADDEIARTYNILKKELDEIAQEAQDIGVVTKRKTTLKPEEFEVNTEFKSLAQEARKFKSADEFVKAFEYHGGVKNLEGGKLSLKFDKAGGIFTTPNETTAKTWQSLRSGELYQVYLGDKKLIDLTEPKTVEKIKGLIGTKYTVNGEVATFTKNDYDFLFPDGKADWATFSNYIPMFEKMGYKGARIAEGFNVNTSLWEDIKPLDKVYTKFQLTDFYNQAVKAKKKLPTGLTPFQREQLEQGKKVFVTAKEPFKPRENFFPHLIPNVEDLSKGVIRRDITENLVRRGVRNTSKEAEMFIDDFVNFLETGGRRTSIIDYMVKTGQAENSAEALSNLQRFRKRTIKKQGSLEFARQVDLPFYDPDPMRVLPKYFASTSKRLAEIKTFGQRNQEINKLINKIRNVQGDDAADTTRTAVDRILNITNVENTAKAKVSSLLRTLQGFKLGLASIPNITQGTLNTMLAGDLRAVGAGLGGLFTQKGKQLGLRSGATLESVINETLAQAGGNKGALRIFLKATGFTATERFNRIFAANGGANYGNRLFQKLLKNPNNRFAKAFLDEMGINVNRALEKGFLDGDDILQIAKKFTDITQFRSRPQDLPLFASSPEGKVFFQFKNFIYGQTRLLYRTTIREFRNGFYGRGIRNLIILATIFPLTGEAIKDIRNKITGRERKEKGLARYLDNIAQVGALGILMDTLQAGKFGKGTEALVGPTFSDFGELVNILGSERRAKNLIKFGIKRTPLVGQVLGPRIFKKK